MIGGQCLLWIGVFHINAAWQEIALDAVGITDANLDVVLLGKSGVGIERISFPENAFNRIVSPLVSTTIDTMNCLNNGAVQLTDKFVSRTTNVCVLRYFLACLVAKFDKDIVRLLSTPANRWSL